MLTCVCSVIDHRWGRSAACVIQINIYNEQFFCTVMCDIRRSFLEQSAQQPWTDLVKWQGSVGQPWLTWLARGKNTCKQLLGNEFTTGFLFCLFYCFVLFCFFSRIWTPDIPISLPSQIFQVNIWWSYSHLGFTGIRTKALCLLIVPKQHFFFWWWQTRFLLFGRKLKNQALRKKSTQ